MLSVARKTARCGRFIQQDDPNVAGTVGKTLKGNWLSNDNLTLKNFLTLRADAFISNDYYPRTTLPGWRLMTIELTIGPYETYKDELFNYRRHSKYS